MSALGLLLKEAVTYKDMAGFLSRTKDSPKIVREDIVSKIFNDPGKTGENFRLTTNNTMPEKMGPVAAPTNTAKLMGLGKEYYNKVFFPHPEEVPNIYGSTLKDPKARTATEGAFLNHEFHELRASKLPRTLKTMHLGHINLPQVVGRADNNFVATASDDATIAAAERLKEMRMQQDAGMSMDRLESENEFMKRNDLNKFKSNPPYEKGQGVRPGFSRINQVARGESVPPLQTEPSGFNFGERKISRKEALARYYKDLGEPNKLLSSENRGVLNKVLKGHREIENDMVNNQIQIHNE